MTFNPQYIQMKVRKIEKSEVEFDKNDLKIFAFLADDKGHAQWEMVEQLKIDKGYLSKLLKGLKAKGLIYNKERPLARSKTRGPPIEYPYYIQMDKFWYIASSVLTQIETDLMEASKHIKKETQGHIAERITAAAPFTQWVKVEEGKCVPISWYYLNRAEQAMKLFDRPLFKDKIDALLRVKTASGDEIRKYINQKHGFEYTSKNGLSYVSYNGLTWMNVEERSEAA